MIEPVLNKTLQQKAQAIRLLILDVDGVLTDGKLYFDNQGGEIKAFHALDGQGIKLLQKTGIEIAIITGRNSQIVANRGASLGIRHILQGRKDKHMALEELRQQYPVEYHEIAHMGDDYPDLLIMQRVGLALSVANGHWAVQKRADWVSQQIGGNGAVREACDLLMLAQGHFDTQLSPYLLA